MMLIPIRFYRKENSRNIVTLEGTCSINKLKARMKVIKKWHFGYIILVPFWGTNYSVTCNRCPIDVDISKKLGSQLEKMKKSGTMITISHQICSSCVYKN